MALEQISAQRYGELFDDYVTIFGKVGFSMLNASKVEEVRFIVDDLDSPSIGITLGRREGTWYAPFSAPFGELAVREALSRDRLLDFFRDLRSSLGAPISLTIPSPIYAPEKIGLVSGVLSSISEASVEDINYHYDLTDFDAEFERRMTKAGRKNFHRAQKSGFSFNPDAPIGKAYEIIRANRMSHDYRLAMTLSQVMDTSRIVAIDAHILSLDEVPVASAIVYHVAPGIVQVVYWGDTPGYSHLRPMNLLPWHLFRHYSAKGLKIIDIGPASTDGIPNEGLCRFKESLGCERSPRMTFRI